jgi:hypothetical protein
VIGEDTDVLVLLCHYSNDNSKGLVFRSDRKTAKSRAWDIDLMRHILGIELCRVLPLLHAIGGCDTTSRLYGIGKGLAVKKFQNGGSFKAQIEILSNDKLKPAAVDIAGEKALVRLYGGKGNETLDKLCLRKFTEKVTSSARSVQVQTLPPTSDAAKYHSRRVYLQSHVWMGSEHDLNPIDWGWKLLNDQRLQPRKMDSLAAPDMLLKVIRCQCRGDCDNLRCSCRKNGMDCSSPCTGCKGTSCSNSPADTMDIDFELEGPE